MNALKKAGNIILIIFGILLILVCADLLTNKTLNKTYDELSETDRQAVGEICKVIDLFDSETGNKDIWEHAYNPADTGFAIIRSYGMAKGYCYLVNEAPPASIFSQKIEMPDQYVDISVYRYAICTPSLLCTISSSFDEGYVTINDMTVPAVKYDRSMVKFSGPGSLEERYAVNSFRDAVDTPDEISAEADVSFVMDAENIALTGLQYRILDELLAADDKELADKLLCEYVLIRERQAARYPDLDKQQQRLELKQGTEQYVYYKISQKTGGGYTYFDKPLSERITFYSAYYYICTGSYGDDVQGYFRNDNCTYTGAALCEIMDKFEMIPGWEKNLDNSTNADFVSQYSLLRDYCSHFNYKDMTPENIQRSYNYEEVLGMAKALVNANAGGE